MFTKDHHQNRWTTHKNDYSEGNLIKKKWVFAGARGHFILETVFISQPTSDGFFGQKLIFYVFSS